MTREVVLRTNLREESHLLIDILRRAPLDQTGNPEADAVRSRLVVLEIPVLEVLVLLVTGAGLGRVSLEGEAVLDAPAHRTRVAEVGSELTPLLDQVTQSCRHILISDRDEVGVLSDLGRLGRRELDELDGSIQKRELLVVRELGEKGGEGVERCLAIHV